MLVLQERITGAAFDCCDFLKVFEGVLFGGD